MIGNITEGSAWPSSITGRQGDSVRSFFPRQNTWMTNRSRTMLPSDLISPLATSDVLEPRHCIELRVKIGKCPLYTPTKSTLLVWNTNIVFEVPTYLITPFGPYTGPRTYLTACALQSDNWCYWRTSLDLQYNSYLIHRSEGLIECSRYNELQPPTMRNLVQNVNRI